MKITRVETLTSSRYQDPEPTWVQIHTDEGLVGLGETWYYQNEATDYIHRTVAPYLLGQDPRLIESHHRALSRLMSFRYLNAEVHSLSAIDVALWDLYGQIVGLPIYQLLGGPSRDRVPVYNTCLGYSLDWKSDSVYREDEVMWRDQDRAGELAQSMLDTGIGALKLWPFDPFRAGGGGQHITPAQIDEALKPFRRIRETVGMQMGIHVELHGGWYLQAAIRIAEALEELRPVWIEDPLSSRDNIDAFAELAGKTRIPVAISESLCGRAVFKEILEKEAAGILNFDICWVGGLTEAHFIAQLAQTYDRPFACHAPTGPVNFTASTHLCMAEPNALIQEGIRLCYLGGWYQDVVTELPKFERGYVSASDAPGLGTQLLPDFASRPDVEVRVSQL